MKKYFIFLSAAALMISSCEKKSDATFVQDANISLDDAQLIKTGIFVFSSEKNTTGLVNIYKQSTGKYILALEQMVFKSPRSVELYLSTGETLTSAAIKLFSFNSVNDSLYYELPSMIDISAFNHVVIQNDISDQLVASAELN